MTQKPDEQKNLSYHKNILLRTMKCLLSDPPRNEDDMVWGSGLF